MFKLASINLKLLRVSTLLSQIQNGRGAVQNNNKLCLNIARVSAILPKNQNGAFVYHNKLSTESHCLPHCLNNIASGCLHHVTITKVSK